MNRILTLILALAINVCNGQSLQAHLDSCSSLNAHDTVVMDCYGWYMTKKYQSDIDGALQAGEEAYKIAVKRDALNDMQEIEGWLGYLYDAKKELEKAFLYNKRALKHRIEIGDKRDIINAYNNLAHTYSNASKLDSAQLVYQQAYEILNDLDDTSYIITVANNISNSYEKMGKYGDALKLRYEVLKLAKLFGEKDGMLTAYMGIGSCQIKAKRYTEALESLDEARSIAAKDNALIKILQIDNHRGEAYEKMENLDSAKIIYGRVLDVVREKNILPAIATLSNNLGVVYSKLEDYNLSIKYHEEAIMSFRQLNQKISLANTLRNIARSYRKTGNTEMAVKRVEEAYAISREIGAKDLELICARSFATQLLYANEFSRSAKLYKTYIELRDSLQVDEQKMEINNLVAKYENEKKELMIENLQVKSEADSLQNAQTKKQNELITAQKNTQRNLFITGSAGLAIVAILFIVIAMNRKKTNRKLETQNHQINKQKDEINDQKMVLEEKNTEILDSINYAKRIQTAILPPNRLVGSYLENSFILYKPKDIVAGDFYWLEPVDDTVLFAAADCTGHGVPGAMVSVVCNNGLNRAVREYGLRDPGQILDKTREIVISEFEKSEEEVKDGMDIALCSLQNNVLKYSGAHNPLWIIRKDSAEIEEVKAHKQPIGKFTEPEGFPTHEIQLNPGDSIYIFSDGYADQFGGEKGKKLKAKNFKSLLLSIQKESMSRQRELIDEAFEEWKGDFEQLDDVCVIGVRV